VLVVIAAAVVLAALGLPYAGRFLIIDDPLRPADAIVVLDSAGAERWLEGVDLYKEKMAGHLILSPGIARPAEVKVRQMGIRYPTRVELVTEAMAQFGVPPSAITVLPRAVDNTADEAAVTRPIVLERGWTSIIVVTSKYHTRRTRFAFEREFDGTGVRNGGSAWESNPARPQRGQRPVLKTGRATGPRSLPWSAASSANAPQRK
jgi:uncharacterized SAM-binding protein YcdF (DUF218 family)